MFMLFDMSQGLICTTATASPDISTCTIPRKRKVGADSTTTDKASLSKASRAEGQGMFMLFDMSQGLICTTATATASQITSNPTIHLRHVGDDYTTTATAYLSTKSRGEGQGMFMLFDISQ